MLLRAWFSLAEHDLPAALVGVRTEIARGAKWSGDLAALEDGVLRVGRLVLTKAVLGVLCGLVPYCSATKLSVMSQRLVTESEVSLLFILLFFATTSVLIAI